MSVWFCLALNSYCNNNNNDKFINADINKPTNRQTHKPTQNNNEGR